MDKLKPYAKAIAAFVSAVVGTALKARGLDTDGGSAITGGEWLEAGLTGLGAGVLIYLVPNKDPLGVKQTESVQPPERKLGM